jgi:hypothetical protein
MDKVEVARRQLGTALDMFLNGRDPVSIHCLAVGGGEVAEWLAKKAGAAAFTSHVLITLPYLTPANIKGVRTKHWNAFKHATTLKGKDRNDDEILAGFHPSHNEHALFIGWYDYNKAGLLWPIEVQVFEVWYLAKYPEKLNRDASRAGIDYLFPDLAGQSSDQQHARLNEVIRTSRNNDKVMNDPRTDDRPLECFANENDRSDDDLEDWSYTIPVP